MIMRNKHNLQTVLQVMLILSYPRVGAKRRVRAANPSGVGLEEKSGGQGATANSTQPCEHQHGNTGGRHSLPEPVDRVIVAFNACLGGIRLCLRGARRSEDKEELFHRGAQLSFLLSFDSMWNCLPPCQLPLLPSRLRPLLMNLWLPRWRFYVTLGGLYLLALHHDELLDEVLLLRLLLLKRR